MNRGYRQRLYLVVACVLIATSATAQVGTEPTAWAPEHRSLADGLSTAVVAIQAEEAARRSVIDWRAGNHATAWRTLCAAGTTLATIEGLKRAIHEPRPDGSDNLSNPSGHAGVLASLATGHYSISVSFAVFGGMLRANANKHHFWGPGKAKDIPIGWTIGALAQVGCRALIHEREPV